MIYNFQMNAKKVKLMKNIGVSNVGRIVPRLLFLREKVRNELSEKRASTQASMKAKG